MYDEIIIKVWFRPQSLNLKFSVHHTLFDLCKLEMSDCKIFKTFIINNAKARMMTCVFRHSKILSKLFKTNVNNWSFITEPPSPESIKSRVLKILCPESPEFSKFRVIKVPSHQSSESSKVPSPQCPKPSKSRVIKDPSPQSPESLKSRVLNVPSHQSPDIQISWLFLSFLQQIKRVNLTPFLLANSSELVLIP